MTVNLPVVVLDESQVTAWSSLTSRNCRTTGLYGRGSLSFAGLIRVPEALDPAGGSPVLTVGGVGDVAVES